MAETLNLHELANTPGYGKAQQAVKEAGFWDDHADDGEMRRWAVDVSYRAEETVVVDARSEEEAMEKAEEEFDNGEAISARVLRSLGEKT